MYPFFLEGNTEDITISTSRVAYKSMEETVHEMVEFFCQNPKVKRSLGDFYIPKFPDSKKTSPGSFSAFKNDGSDDPFLSVPFGTFSGGGQTSKL